MVVLSLTESVVVKERSWGFAALGRSFELTKGHFWPILLMVILFFGLGVLPWIVATIASVWFPIGNDWYSDAAIDMSVDVLGVYTTTCFYLIYRQITHSRKSW